MMIGRFSVCAVFVLVQCVPALQLAVGEDVKFDAPAILAANHLHTDAVSSSNEKLIEIVVPISAQIQPTLRDSMNEFRFDIYWNRSAYPIFDYGPKTQTFSGIDGTISVEKRHDKNRSLGLNLSSGYQDIVSGSANAALSNNIGSTIRYQEIPQFDVLVAAGTIKRGTGAFFRFHPSKKDTLEGGRDLVVAFRVANNWRGGILQVECRAEGEKKLLGPWGDEIRVGQAFVVPVYLEGDDQAREIAFDFAQAQIALTQKWNRNLNRKSSKNAGFKHEIETLFGVSSASSVPSSWTEYLIQTGDDRHYDQYYRQLSEPIRSAATEFIEARKQLVSLAR